MIRTTIVGGIAFLLPLVILAFILGKAFELSMLIAAPIDEIVHIGSFAGVALANILAIIIILAVCYIAGLVARLQATQRRVGALDNALLQMLPAYAFVKTMVSSVIQAESEAQAMHPVMVRLDDMTQIAFEVERRGGEVVVFLPGAPSPWSGSVAIVEESRVTPLKMPSHRVVKMVQLLGRGSLAQLNEAKDSMSGGSAKRA